MTYCFHQGDGSIVENGRTLDCVWEAQERGVLFDVGDGGAAFGFDVAETAIAEGFISDTISTDVYRYHVSAGLTHDLPLTMSKLIAAGMTAEQCWPRITSTPAHVMGLGDKAGAIRPGAPADLCVLRLEDSTRQLKDGSGGVRTGRAWRPVATFKDGKPVRSAETGR
jgi:dihydroorotase